jgi:hypothetical protein
MMIDDRFAESLEAMMAYEMAVKQVLTLAIEYQAKTITAERFADRTIEILHGNLAKFAERKQSRDAAPQRLGKEE